MSHFTGTNLTPEQKRANLGFWIRDNIEAGPAGIEAVLRVAQVWIDRADSRDMRDQKQDHPDLVP